MASAHSRRNSSRTYVGVSGWSGGLLAALCALVLSACSADGPVDGPKQCTEVGAPSGIGIEVDAPLSNKVSDDAILVVAWGDSAIEAEVELVRSTEPVAEDCSDGDEDADCAASMEPTPWKSGFADIPDLPGEPVEVTITIPGIGDEPDIEGQLEVTPEETFPNGHDCPAGGFQAQLIVDDDGEISVG